MNLRHVATENSVWIFDLELMRYLRLPKQEAPNVDAPIPYRDGWDEFTRIEPMGDRLMVHRPVPFGTGALRQTGPVLSDSAPGPWPIKETGDE